MANINAQQIHRCYTNEYIDYLSLTDPYIKQNIQESFNAAKLHASNQMSIKSTVPGTIYRIPVVFHVVYNTTQENTSDALIMSQLDVINKDFRKLNADTINHRPVFKDRASDVGFEFFMATIDPDGNPTTGITRTQTSVTSFGGFFPNPNEIDKVKFTADNGKDAWDTDNYLNIWICNTGGSILGFAYPPETAPNWPAGQTPADQGKWGIVISYEVFGFNNPLAIGALSIANQGRTAIHELGHYFGLRHIWGDSGFFGSIDCDITKDDGISDTPHMGNNSQNDGCDFSKNTCANGETPDEPDMPENYMDYSEESCQNMFTQGQADIMQSMAVTGRPQLAYIIADDIINLSLGSYVVINGTDTILIDETTIIVINIGDEILFLNENNGYAYTASNSGVLNGTDNYTVTANGTITVDEPNAINNINVNNQLITVFPNPSNSSISLINNSNYSISQISITDIEGKSILLEKEATFYKNHIDLSYLNTGLYFISIYEGDKLFSVKKLSILK
jgi:hypothetical protein